jgi:hypothetical protein
MTVLKISQKRRNLTFLRGFLFLTLILFAFINAHALSKIDTSQTGIDTSQTIIENQNLYTNVNTQKSAKKNHPSIFKYGDHTKRNANIFGLVEIVLISLLTIFLIKKLSK